MALWPFRKRRKTKVAEGKKVAAPDPPPAERKMFLARKNSNRQNPRRTGSHHHPKDGSYAANNRVGLPEFPQPLNGSSSPIPIQDSFHPQKQRREGGFSSFFIEQNHSMSASSASSHRPHKPTSIVRKLSKRGRDRSQQPQPPPSAYITQLARTASKRDKKRIRNFDELEDDRPMSRSSHPARDSINSSLSSQSSMRAYKVRNIFTPRPKLHYENSTGTSPMKSARLHPLTPSRSNSRSIRDGRHARAGITEEELLRGGRVDELADELDVHGIKEALDRDRRRKERKKREDHEKLQRKLERRAAKQREQEQMDREMGFEMDDDHFQRNLYSGRNYGAPEYQTGESSRSAGRAEFMLTPEPYPFPDPDDRPRDGRTPLSWIHDPSQEDINRAARSTQRVDMVTPVSMDSNRDTTGGPEYCGPEQTDSYKPTGPLAQSHEPSHTGGTRHVDDYQPTFRGGFVVDDDDMDRDGLDAGIDPGRGKASGWTSFLKKATAARMRKEQGTRGIQLGESALISDSEGEETHGREPGQGSEFYEVDDLRKNQGQTPGTHIPDEVAFAMTALETGHVRGKDSSEAEKRGSFTPGRPLLPYSLHGRPSSSKSSLTGLPHRVPTSNPRSYVGSIDFGIDSPTLPIQPIRTSSTHSQNHYGRPSPTQRYSPSMHRHSLEAVGPDGRPRSLMSTSLASIDSEGSWLSGRVANPRGSINHISPLRTSATSLRRRYQEFDDNGSTNGDDYFSGVTPRRKRMENGGDDEMNGVTRLDLSDVEDSDEEGSVGSEAEKKMWRDGLGKKVVVHEVVTTSRPPVDPKTAVLKAAQASTTTATATTALSKDDQQSTTMTRQSWGPASEVEEFTTPMEHPYAQTYNNLEFKTPMEHPAARQSSCAEFVGR